METAALRLFWRGVLDLFVPRYPIGLVPDEALFVGFFLTGYKIGCLALGNLGFGILLLAHDLPHCVQLMRLFLKS